MQALTLYCLPHAGSSALPYLRWRHLLPAWISIEPVELPGRGARADEPLLQDFDQLHQSLATSLGSRLREPYALFGHSLGGLLAFELAHAFTQQGRPPLALLVSASTAPRCRDDIHLGQLNMDAALISKLSMLGGMPASIMNDAEILAELLPVVRADFKVCASYQYRRRPLLDCPVHVFGGRDDTIPAGALAPWAGETRAESTLEWFEGGHFYWQGQEHLLMPRLQLRLAAIWSKLTSTVCLT